MKSSFDIMEGNMTECYKYLNICLASGKVIIEGFIHSGADDNGKLYTLLVRITER